MVPSGIKTDDSIYCLFETQSDSRLNSSRQPSLAKHQNIMEENQAAVAWNASNQGTAVLLSPAVDVEEIAKC